MVEESQRKLLRPSTAQVRISKANKRFDRNHIAWTTCPMRLRRRNQPPRLLRKVISDPNDIISGSDKRRDDAAWNLWLAR